MIGQRAVHVAVRRREQATGAEVAEEEEEAAHALGGTSLSTAFRERFIS